MGAYAGQLQLSIVASGWLTVGHAFDLVLFLLELLLERETGLLRVGFLHQTLLELLYRGIGVSFPLRCSPSVV